MKSYKDYKELFESTASDIAAVDTKLDLKTRVKKIKDDIKRIKEPKNSNINESTESETLTEGKTPEEILRKNNIKIKSSEMDDDSYVILLFKKDEMKSAKKILEDEGYIVHEVGKLLYIS